MVTTNISLKTSTVGVTTDSLGSQNDQDNLQLLDLHDHTTGKGVRIPTAGVNINADLEFNNNSATELEGASFTSQVSNSAVANTIFVKNGELYYVDASLNVVQLTSGGSISLVTSISGQVLLDGGNTRGANVRFGTNDLYNAIIETNNTDRLSINSDGFTQILNDLGIKQGAANSTTGTQNNVSTSGLSYIRFTGASATSITGLSNGSDGKILVITNKTGTQLTLNNNNSGSLAANRILTGTGADLAIENNASVLAIYDSTASLWNVVGGSGSGTSGLPVYSVDLSSGTLYNDSSAIPVDGTGGTTTGMTFAAVTSGTLRGAVSYKLSKDAANRQGNGVAFNLTIDNADKATVQSVTFDISSSANFVSGDAYLYVYDVTNSALLSSFAILPTGTQGQFSRAVALTTGTSYRILIHCASTSALAYDITLDAMSVSSIVRPQVAGISDWIAYTPTISAGFGTVTGLTAYYKRIGDNMQIRATWTNGTTVASLASMSLPSTFTLDTTKLPISANTTASSGSNVGTYGTPTASSYAYVVTAPGTSTSNLYFSNWGAGVSSLLPQNGTSFSSSVVMSMDATIPIAQWSSNITLSSTNAAIEYASNSSATDADDTSSFVPGATGSAGVFKNIALTTLRKKRVQFSAPIQPTDRLQLEVSIGGGNWVPAVGTQVFASQGAEITAARAYGAAAGQYEGMGLTPVSGSTTQIDVLFGTYINNNNTIAWNNASIPANTRWRVAKISSIGGTELAPATELTQGTVGFSQWASYTPTIGSGAGTATSIVAQYRREGDSMRIKGKFTTGTVAASLVSISLPGSYTIDTNKMYTNTTTASSGERVGTIVRALTTANAGVKTIQLVACTTTSTSLIYVGSAEGVATAPLIPSNGGTNFNSTELQAFEALIPISGWN